MKRLFSSLAVVALIALPGCGLPLDGGSWEAVTTTYSLDGVKLISPDYVNGSHPRTFSQDEYDLAPARRLLLRYESFYDQIGKVDLSGERRVLVDIAVPQLAQLEEARTRLTLCPLTQNWMMLATWYAPHSGPGARWGRPGGDYDEAGCVAGTAKVPATATGGTTVTGPEPVLVFDVTRWFVDYARGRNEDFGLILIASAPVRIVGDRSGSYSPRIRFHKR